MRARINENATTDDSLNVCATATLLLLQIQNLLTTTSRLLLQLDSGTFRVSAAIFMASTLLGSTFPITTVIIQDLCDEEQNHDAYDIPYASKIRTPNKYEMISQARTIDMFKSNS